MKFILATLAAVAAVNGEVCWTGKACMENANDVYCDVSTFTCMPRRSAGGFCTEDNQCVSGVVCTDNTCVSTEPTPAPPTNKPTRRTRSPVTERPTREPTNKRTRSPNTRPTREPTTEPTRRPTREPTNKRTRSPNSKPTRMPSPYPTRRPSKEPTFRKTRQPTTRKPVTQKPLREGRTHKPTRTLRPTRQPTDRPTRKPTKKPIFKEKTGAGPPPDAVPTNAAVAPTNAAVAPTNAAVAPTNAAVVEPTPESCKPESDGSCCLDGGCSGLAEDRVDGACCPSSDTCCPRTPADLKDGFLCCEEGFVCTPLGPTMNTCGKPVTAVDCPNCCGRTDCTASMFDFQVDGNCCPEGHSCCGTTAGGYNCCDDATHECGDDNTCVVKTMPPTNAARCTNIRDQSECERTDGRCAFVRGACADYVAPAAPTPAPVDICTDNRDCTSCLAGVNGERENCQWNGRSCASACPDRDCVTECPAAPTNAAVAPTNAAVAPTNAAVAPTNAAVVSVCADVCRDPNARECNESECNNVRGCTFFEGDRGTPAACKDTVVVAPTNAAAVGCADISDERICTGTDGCTFSDRECQDTVVVAPTNAAAVGCADIDEERDCNLAAGCEWPRGGRECQDTVVVAPTNAAAVGCADISDERQCGNTDGCTYGRDGCEAE